MLSKDDVRRAFTEHQPLRRDRLCRLDIELAASGEHSILTFDKKPAHKTDRPQSQRADGGGTDSRCFHLQLFLGFRSQHSRDRFVIHREYLIEGDIDLAAAAKAFRAADFRHHATALCAARQHQHITDQNIFLYREGDRISDLARLAAHIIIQCHFEDRIRRQLDRLHFIVLVSIDCLLQALHTFIQSPLLRFAQHRFFQIIHADRQIIRADLIRQIVFHRIHAVRNRRSAIVVISHHIRIQIVDTMIKSTGRCIPHAVDHIIRLIRTADERPALHRTIENFIYTVDLFRQRCHILCHDRHRHQCSQSCCQ